MRFFSSWRSTRSAFGLAAAPSSESLSRRLRRRSIRRPSSRLRENIKLIVWAGLFALLLRSFLLEPYRIPSGSMIPTLEVGDFLFVSKYDYGYSKYALPFSPNLWEGRFFARMPRRGDVVVFRLPTDPSTNYVKRIIGLPGDTIQVDKGLLYLNATLVQRASAAPYYFGSEETIPVQRYTETLPGGRDYAILEINGDSGSSDQTPVYTVPENHFFVMGDNRDSSQDSRYLNLVGFVPFDNLIGKTRLVLFSFDEHAPWFFPFRTERFFKSIP